MGYNQQRKKLAHGQGRLIKVVSGFRVSCNKVPTGVYMPDIASARTEMDRQFHMSGVRESGLSEVHPTEWREHLDRAMPNQMISSKGMDKLAPKSKHFSIGINQTEQRWIENREVAEQFADREGGLLFTEFETDPSSAITDYFYMKTRIVDADPVKQSLTPTGGFLVVLDAKDRRA